MERGGEIADHFPFELKDDAVIGVMGLPYTFRQEMGTYIARWAECPNLKFEVIHDELRHVNDAAALTNPAESDDVAFNILCKTALHLLADRSQPNCVVINFPTPTNPQLQRLLSLHDKGRLLIIECRRQNRFRWRRDVEHPNRTGIINLWSNTGNTKPGKWEDVDKAIFNHQQQGLDHYFLSLAERVRVKKLAVNPFEDFKARDFTQNQGLDRRSLFAQAIKSYLACDDAEYLKLAVNLDYSIWRRQWLEHQASSSRSGGGTSTTERRWCGPGDCILRFTENLQQAVAICEACEEKLACTEGEGKRAYYCQICSLVLHELCALAESAAAKTAKSTNPHSQVLSYYYRSCSSYDPFEESTHACFSCKKDGKPFSIGCDACVFRTHLKYQLLPTALKHSCDQPHLLSLRLLWHEFAGIYDCKACGLKGGCSSYSCNICNSDYHLQCVLDMPLHTNQIPHGGHTHTLNLNFSCGQREHEYEWCPVCYADINPDTWVYKCQHCDFVAHLYCIFPSDLFDIFQILTQDEHIDWITNQVTDISRHQKGIFIAE